MASMPPTHAAVRHLWRCWRTSRRSEFDEYKATSGRRWCRHGRIDGGLGRSQTSVRGGAQTRLDPKGARDADWRRELRDAADKWRTLSSSFATEGSPLLLPQDSRDSWSLRGRAEGSSGRRKMVNVVPTAHAQITVVTAILRRGTTRWPGRHRPALHLWRSSRASRSCGEQAGSDLLQLQVVSAP